MKTLHFSPFVLRIIIILFFIPPTLCAQDISGSDDKKEIPNIYTGISSVVLQKDATEINLINSISSFWVAFNEFDGAISATRIANRVRYSRADHVLRVAHGFSRSGRWDLGADFFYTSVRVDDVARSSPFRVLSKNETLEGVTNSGLSSIGLQVRFVPFADIPELTLRAGMAYPIAKTEQLRAQLNAQRWQLFLSGVYLNRLSPGMLAFLQGDFRAHPRNLENDATLFIPSFSGFLLFELPNDRWYIFPGLAYNVVFQQFAQGYRYRKANQQLYGSLGVLYRAGRSFSLLLSGQVPFIFESGSTSVIWVRESYVGVNLGLRFIL
jgi:hypothetical protein